jgi:hypothetical protein
MSAKKRVLAIVALVLVAALVCPAVASAVTIYVNKGVAGATLGMKDTTAAKKLGKVKEKKKDTRYDTTAWMRGFGTKSHGRWSLELYSNSKDKVTSFIIFAAKYKTGKGIHTGSSLQALKDAYGDSLTHGGGYYKLQASTGKTWFTIKGGKVSQIWVWRQQ